MRFPSSEHLLAIRNLPPSSTHVEDKSDWRHSSPPLSRTPALREAPSQPRVSEVTQVSALQVERLIGYDNLHDPPRDWRPPSGADRCRPNAPDGPVCCFEDFVLPESTDPPAESLEALRLCAVPLDVLGELAGPEIAGTSRADVVIGAAMPEATVNEDSYACAREGDVRVSDGSLRVAGGTAGRHSKAVDGARAPVSYSDSGSAPSARTDLAPCSERVCREPACEQWFTPARVSANLPRPGWKSLRSHANLGSSSDELFRRGDRQTRLDHLAVPTIR